MTHRVRARHAGLASLALAGVLVLPRSSGQVPPAEGPTAPEGSGGPDERTVARARDVGLGGISGNRVAVTTGVRAGEKVIVTGASLLVDGDPVRVIPGSEGE